MALPSSGPLALTDIQGEFGGANPIGMNEYYAGGGLVPAGTSGTYGAVPSSGTISVQNFYGTSNYTPIYIEDVFSTWIYTGNGSTQTITNNINLSGNGGLAWFKSRSNAFNNWLYDTARGASYGVIANNTLAQINTPDSVTSFNSNGFSLGADSNNGVNRNTSTYVSWTFRKQPKFFDVVTYTGNGVTGRSIAHNLGAIPGAIIIKNTSSSTNWAFALATDLNNWSGTSKILCLNTTDQDSAGNTYVNGFINDATSTTFQVVGFSGNQLNVNQSGETYVAYLFASNAGGFGLTGSDNVITCGSTTGSAVVNLGYEPQWVLSKCAGSAGQDWTIVDNMRGAPVPSTGNTPYSSNLMPNLSNAETTTGVNGASVIFNSTGFRLNPNTTVAVQYIYIAIRRGPMKVPTVGTSVYNAIARTGTGAAANVTGAGFPPSLVWAKSRTSTTYFHQLYDRLRGATKVLNPNATQQENTDTAALTSFGMDGFSVGTGAGINQSSMTFVNWCFQRAPNFFDEVCYTGNNASSQTIYHNLGVTPEMIIVKVRNASDSWYVYTPAMPATNQIALYLNSSMTGSIPGTGGAALWGLTSTTFQANYTAMNLNATDNYVAYLFATCAGVSKVGSYTGAGTGTTQTINCGFTTGARYVLIRRITSAGDWYVWDSARGISSGNDPYLVCNTEDAEVTGTNYVDTTSVGFQITAAAPQQINGAGSTFIFLAIA